MATHKRTVGSLTHADFGRHIQVPGVIRGILWGIQHVGVMGDQRQPWTRLTVLRDIGASEATRGLHPDTVATLTDLDPGRARPGILPGGALF